MPTALLYMRSDGSDTAPFNVSSLSDDTGATTPELLATNFPDQVLSFIFDENILEGIDFSYNNNITDISAPLSDGTRRINKQENGLGGISLTINGVFENPKTLNADIAKLKLISSRVNLDPKHIYGKIGFYSPNAPEFNLDPNATSGSNATIGYTVSGFKLGYIGQQVTRYGFSITLSFGGTYTSPL